MKPTPPASRRAPPLLMLLVLWFSVGCQPSRVDLDHPGRDLPVYPSGTPEQVLAFMAERQARVHAWRAQGTLTLIEAASRVQLDVIVLADLADPNATRLRVRGSKLGRTVLDVVSNEGGLWYWADDKRQATPGITGRLPLHTVPLRLDPKRLRLARTTPTHFVYHTALLKHQPTPTRVWVHRETRSVHIMEHATEAGPVTLAMGYQPAEPAAALDRLHITAPDQRRVVLRFERVEQNPQLTDAQFAPLPGSQRFGAGGPLHPRPAAETD